MIKVVQAFTVPKSLCFVENQVEFWQQNGFQLHLFTSKKEQLLAFSKRNQVLAKPIAFRRSAFAWGYDLYSLFQLIIYFIRHRPDIVHGNTPKAALISMIAARVCRVPIRIYEMHGLPLETASRFEKPILKLFEKVACACATNVIAVSESLQTRVLEYQLTRPEKISVIHYGSCGGIDTIHKFNPARVDSVDVQQLRQTFQIECHHQVVGFVGRLTRDKGVGELYEAWQIIKQTHPYARLLLLGGEDERVPLSSKTRQKIKSDKSIIWAGEVVNVVPYYALMDFLVLPSYREGLGNVVLEAAAMTKPTVATYVTGLKNTVIHHETGLFCAPRSVEDLADKIMLYLRSPALAYAHGQASRKYVESKFSAQIVIEAKLRFYQRLCAEAYSVPLRYVSPSFQAAD